MFSRYMIARTCLLPLLLAMLVCFGCGQKGALYLPDDTASDAAQQE